MGFNSGFKGLTRSFPCIGWNLDAGVIEGMTDDTWLSTEHFPPWRWRHKNSPWQTFVSSNCTASPSAAPLCPVSDVQTSSVCSKRRQPHATRMSLSLSLLQLEVDLQWRCGGRCVAEATDCGLPYGGEQHSEITQVCSQTVAGQYRHVTSGGQCPLPAASVHPLCKQNGTLNT